MFKEAISVENLKGFILTAVALLYGWLVFDYLVFKDLSPSNFDSKASATSEGKKR